MKTVEESLAIISAGTAHITPLAELVKKFSLGRKLRVKLGMDPTSPNLHLGHTLVLSKMKEFQDLGHDVIFLIGDFTARIGDPTGRSQTRPPLSQEEIAYNMKTYFQQVEQVLDITKTTICCNSQWLSKLSGAEFIQLCGKVTLARVLEREDFQKRFHAQQPIGLHEFMYPLLQAYDSVELKADIELGGTDQTFNLLMGRVLQEQMGQEPQVIITMPLLEGLDGVQKMSKSYGNAIGITEPPAEAYGKLMSISDNLMWRYYALLLHTSEAEIAQMKDDVIGEKLHPMNLKKEMAHQIVARFWSKDMADRAQTQFEALFQKKDYSKARAISLQSFGQDPVWIVDVLKKLGAVTTSSQAKSLIESGAVHVDDTVIADFKAHITMAIGMILKIGKHRIYKIDS